MSEQVPVHAREAASALPYRDDTLPAEERADDLLARMTLPEKAAQMMCVWNEKDDTLLDEDGAFDAEKAATAFSQGNGIGQVGRPNDAGGRPSVPEEGLPPRALAELTNAIQRFFVEESRLGIPVIFHEECLHGLAAKDATSFPQPIGLGATFDPELVEAVYAVAAHEARTRGAHQALTPVLDVARDARWGRVEETFGEDPFLVGKLGGAAVDGFQGDSSFSGTRHVLATLKHFAAHGQPEGGMNCAPVNVSERGLREVFLEPFRKAIQEHGAASVMASYNEIDGVPSHASRWLLHDVLREEWGFEGFVVSDYYAIWELHDRPDTHGHHIASGKAEAARLAVEAGVNIELPEPDCYESLVELVEDGTLDEARLDDLVRPMLRAKLELGLFDDPYVDPDEAERVARLGEHRDLARQAAQESITLLKNEGNAAPLALDGLDTLAVIGPNADRSLLGGYNGAPAHDVSVLDGVAARAEEEGVDVVHCEGCKITVGGSWHEDAVTASDPEEDARQIAEAAEAAATADAVVLALGGNEQTSREAWARGHQGDRPSLELVGRQNALVDAVLDAVSEATPVIAFLFNGRPLAVNHLAEHVPAIFECWYLGQETGHAVADVLFGDVNPSGKLPISVPRSAGHVPAFYNHKPSARRGYLFDEPTALYPFGHGLSYTSFAFENVRLDDDTIAPDGATRVHVDVTNTGARAGTEVVQLYVRDRVSSVTRPVKELKGFARVALDPGETQTVALDVTPDALAFYGIDKERIVEPGAFDLMVGPSSRDDDLQAVALRVS